MHSPFRPSLLFHAHVSNDLLASSLRVVFDSYRNAKSATGDAIPGRPEAKALLPYMQRAMIEYNWRTHARRFNGVLGTSKHNVSRTARHTTIVAGPVRLTQSKVGRRGEIVRDALFRQTYARSAQWNLWRAEEPPPANAKLYGILIHSPSDDPTIPLFADIVFPDRECTHYIETIRLFDMFPQIVNEYTGGVEDIEIVPPPSILPDTHYPTGSTDSDDGSIGLMEPGDDE